MRHERSRVGAALACVAASLALQDLEIDHRFRLVNNRHIPGGRAHSGAIGSRTSVFGENKHSDGDISPN